MTDIESAGTAVPAKPRRRAPRALAAVLAAALVGVGVGELIIKVHYEDGPDRPAVAAPAPAPSASGTAPWGAKSNGNHFGSLRDLLLPVPDGYRLGPDYKGLGNDGEFAGTLEQAQEEELSAVPEKYRGQYKEALTSLHFTGLGVRTLVPTDDRLMVVLKLTQFNQLAVSERGALFGALVDDTDLFRRGPDVPGHPDARCALPPLVAGDQLDYMSCYSAEGDLLVGMRVSGVAPLDQNKVVDLFRQQLDRLARPGASA
ncbi:hypothetical protein Kpho02_08220 [Kitasatospora phosalacinea]|uniref:Secreted protein n=1 Tax=Kitasatospora phosalacinea TaxID=2065 RepID=A0A9W6UZR8_9ACTN|nr:hypothetical protein [Kitasatospora phosalacinea]GLW68523.1 hypothetical protein Kpho02_08220 [Kitasatospora phosalacinea]